MSNILHQLSGLSPWTETLLAPLARLLQWEKPSQLSSDAAIAAWNRFAQGRPQMELTQDDPEPFTPGRRLGGGGVGIVHETFIEGIAVALKRTYTRRLSPHQLNEIKILGRISEKRHCHVVELIGSYIHTQRGHFELGLLIWPVAHTDLAALLHCYHNLAECFNAYFKTDMSLNKANVALLAAIEPLGCFSKSEVEKHHRIPPTFASYILRDVRQTLTQSIGCIAEAVAYLHDQGIRHKDLKPSQILISPNGLWLTDFGWSSDVSGLSQSATSGGDIITAKYHAPERANSLPCGRSEDIFGLGCIYLEISHAAAAMENPRFSEDTLTYPWWDSGFSFHDNLAHLHEWIRPRLNDQERWFRTTVVKHMLAESRHERPTINTVISLLRNGARCHHGSLFGLCCSR